MPSRLIFIALLLPGFNFALGQDEDPFNRPREEPTGWSTFQPEMQGRMGKVKFGEMPESLDFSNSRVSTDGFKMGRFNTFLGVDVDAPSSRLGNYKRPVPRMPSEILAEKPAIPKPEVPSANIPVEAQVSASQSTPLRRHPNFFERPDVVEPATGESMIRTPAEQRWFRDIGRRPGLIGMDGRSRVPIPDGEAMMVGSEMLSQEQSATVSGTDSRFQAVQNRQATAVEQARARRLFEQKLEGLLLGSPSVQFLSPVQISFQNGVATVRGVVPDSQHKVAAGNLLLGDPAVKQVNNLISTVPTDPGKLPAPIEPK